MEQGEGVAEDAAAGFGVDEAPHLREEVFAFFAFHEAVVGGGVHERDVFVGCEQLLADAADDLNVVEVATVLEFAALVGDLFWLGRWPRHSADADFFIAGLNLGKERIEATGIGMHGLCEGEHAAVLERGGGQGIALFRIEPVPGVGGEDQVEGLFAGLPVFKARVDDGDLRECGEFVAGDAGEVGSHFETDDAATAAGERQGSLTGSAADFEDMGCGGVEAGVREEVVEDLRVSFVAATVIDVGDLVEGACAADSRLVIHGWCVWRER